MSAVGAGNQSHNQSFLLLAMPVWVGRLVAIVAAITFLVAQVWLGLNTLILPTLLLLGVSLAVVSVPCWGRPQWATPLSMGTLLLVVFAGYLPAVMATVVVGLVAAVGFIGTVLMVVRLTKQVKWLPLLGTTLLALLLGWWLATYLYGYMYTPNIAEELLAGTYTGDTMFHAAVSNMIRTHGVPSTGLHFPLLLHYHVGGHWVIGQLAAALNVGTLAMYQMASTILFVPMLTYFTLALYTVWVEKTQPEAAINKGLIGVGLALVGVYFAISNGLPTMMTDDLLVDFFSLIRSESYLLSVVVSLGLIVWIVQQPLNNSHRPAWQTVAVAAICLPLIFILKVSTGMMLMGGLGYAWLRLGGFKSMASLLCCGVGVGLCLLAYKWFTPGVYMLQKQSLAFLKTYVHTDFWLYFVLAHSLWVWLYAGVNIYKVSPISLPDWVSKITRGKFILLETLLVMTLVSYIPMMTTVTKGGAAIYFTDVVKWLALPFALAVAVPPLARWLHQAWHPQNRWRFTVLWLVVAVFALTNIGEVVAQSKRLFKGHASNMRAMRALPQQAKKQAFYQKLQVLSQINDKQHALVYIPKSNTFFWNEWLANRRDGAERACKYAAFSVPAITGLAMVYGLPPQQSCPHLDGYGFKPYFDEFDAAEFTQFEANPCSFIAKQGYTTLYRFDDGIELTTVECTVAVTPTP